MKLVGLYSIFGILAMLVGCDVDHQSTASGSGDEGGEAAGANNGGAGGSGCTASGRQTSSEGGTGGASMSTSTACSGDCDDGNYCTVDICSVVGCAHLAYPSPHECVTDKNGFGLCVWSACVLSSCHNAANGEACFSSGGIGTCQDDNCL